MLQRYLYLLPLLCWLAASAARAQVYEPGYLVRANGDTLRGEIENAFWDEPPTYVRFRAAAGAPSQLLLPRQLQALSLTNGRYYQYQVLPIDHSAQHDLSHLPYGNARDVRQDSVLAEVLVDGPVMLWRVQHDEVLHLLVRRPGQPVLELTERRYLRQDTEGRWVVADGNNYRAQLQQYFGDCPAVAQALDHTGYSAPELVALLRTYYQACAPGQGVAHSWLNRSALHRRATVQGGVLAGVRYSTFGNDCAGCRVRPFGGLYLEVMQPSRIAAVYGELSLSSFANTASQYSYQKQGYDEYPYEALLVTARLGLRRLVPLPRERYFLYGFGLELNFIGPVTAVPTSNGVLDRTALSYATPIVLPNLTLGWRHQRLTLLLDGQFYRVGRGEDPGIAGFFIGNAAAVRAGVSYRLGPHPDRLRRARTAP